MFLKYSEPSLKQKAGKQGRKGPLQTLKQIRKGDVA